MNHIEPLTVDVREELRRGGEPLPRIMRAVGELVAGQPLRVLATFEPLPLYAVLGRQGFSHRATRLGSADWEVVFTREGVQGAQPEPPATPAAPSDDWPKPSVALDNRGLDPPEPLIRILSALEQLAPGEVLEAINERDPVFLYPELQARGAAVRTATRADGSVHILIRRGP